MCSSLTTNYYYSTIEPDTAPEDAQFAVVIKGHELEPFVKAGGSVFCSRTALLDDGDVGLFLIEDKMVCRQYCEDALGNIHLFSVNRSLSCLDLHIQDGKKVFCFGKVIMEPVPLPA